MGKFSNFNLSSDDLKNKVSEVKKNSNDSDREVPTGNYVAAIEKLYVGETKDGRPMFRVQMRIRGGEFTKWCIFENKVLAGTKNDLNMIRCVTDWIGDVVEDGPEFTGDYDVFAEEIDALGEELEGLECLVDYDKSRFCAIKVTEVYE